jgi:hypothetical protein
MIAYCCACGAGFTPQRRTATYCSGACRKRGSRAALRASQGAVSVTEDGGLYASNTQHIAAGQGVSDVTLTGACPLRGLAGLPSLARAHRRAVEEGRQGCTCKAYPGAANA